MPSSSEYQVALDAIKEPYSEEQEKGAVEAVKTWLKSTEDRQQLVDEYKNKVKAVKGTLNHDDQEPCTRTDYTLLMVASKYGYLEVVKTLLKDEDLVKCELTDRAQEMRRRDRQGILDDVLSDNDEPPSNFTLARQEVDKLDEEFSRPWGGETGPTTVTAAKALQNQEEHTQRKCKQVRCASCRDMITLYSYIGEEIPDVPTLISVIDALRALGFMSMDDIQDHWDKVRDELREKGIKKGGDDEHVKIEPSLLAQLTARRGTTTARGANSSRTRTSSMKRPRTLLAARRTSCVSSARRSALAGHSSMRRSFRSSFSYQPWCSSYYMTSFTTRSSSGGSALCGYASLV